MSDDQYGLSDFGDEDSMSFGEDVSSPLVGTLRIGKTEYAIDLHWNIPVEPNKAASEARRYRVGEQDRPDYFCVKTGRHVQYGLGYASLGHKPNLAVLAPHICENVESSFIGLFEVEGGYYLIGAVDGLILSDAEQFYSKESDAFDAFTRTLGMNDFSVIYAPESMGVEGSVPRDIEDIISGKPPSRLKDTSKSSGYIKLVLFIAILGIVIFGVRYYLNEAEMQRIAAEIQQQAELASQRVGLKEEEVPIPPMPWENLALGAKALEACHAEILKFPLDIPYWQITDLNCTLSGSGVSVTSYLRRDKTLEAGGPPISYAIQMAKDNGISPRFSSRAENGTAENIAFDWSVTNLPTIPVDIKTETILNIRTSLLQIMESRRTSYTISPADSNQYWKGINIEFDTHLSPISFADIIEAIPGFVFTSLDYQLEQNRFTIKGKAYEQLPIPINQAN